MKQAVTLKDLARELNIATSTVSRALKGSPEISAITRARVQKLAKELNYEPNALALSLRHSKTNTIGVILPELVHFFFSTVISGIEDIAYSNGYNIIICQSNENIDREILDTKALFNHRVDGILACVSRNTSVYDHFIAIQDKGIPIVFFDRDVPIDASKILSNDFEGGYNATKHLIESGKINLIHLSGPEGLMLSEQRTRGFIQAHQDLGIPFNKEKILRCGDGDAQENYKIIQNTLKKGMKFDGIFAVNDIAAVGALQALQAAHISVPQEVAIVGYSDWQFSSFISPRLTTIRQNGNEMGRKATELLLEEIHSKDIFIEPKCITLPTKIILRETTLNK